MQMKFITLLVGCLFLSTALTAAEMKSNPSSSVSNKDTSREWLKNLNKANTHNQVFDNYHTGSSSTYEHKK